MKKPNYLVAGGAGFIGSNIVRRLIQSEAEVTVIDGLFARTGARRQNLRDVEDRIRMIDSPIEDISNLDELIAASDVVVDAMAWTAHRPALEDPEYDLMLNARSHLPLINSLRKVKGKRIIYLGSRVQYGNPGVDTITEDTPMVPDDVQGIHKLAAESYYRLYARLDGLDVVSLRFPNCYGENQPVTGADVGLIGNFIKEVLADENMEIFGEGRSRYLLYVQDLAAVVDKLSRVEFSGFSAYNLAGRKMTIREIVTGLIEIAGQGSYHTKEMPAELKAIDMGNANFSDAALRAYLGELPETDFREAFEATVSYFKEMQH